MRRRRLFRIGAAAFALALVATACGDDDDDSGGEATTTAAGATTTAAATTTAGGATTTAGGATTTAGGETGGQVSLDELCDENADVEVPADFKVALVTDIGKVDDRTFNQYAFEGMKAAEECFGIETTYIETASEADYAKNIATVLDFDPDVVVTVGFLLANDTLAAAQENTGVNWIGIDQFHPEFPDNYIGVLFREDQGGFLAGALAGLLTESNVVGVVGGREDVPPVVRFVNAYITGAAYTNPDAEVLYVYNESFTDPAKGASDAAQFIGEGADVIFGAGGKTGSGAVQEAAKQGLWGIGVDQDEYFTTFNSGAAEGSEYLATSAVKRVDLAVFVNIVEAIKGTFAGGIFSLDAANGGITYAPFHDAEIPDDIVAQLEEVRQGLADGSIDTGVDPVTGLPK